MPAATNAIFSRFMRANIAAHRGDGQRSDISRKPQSWQRGSRRSWERIAVVAERYGLLPKWSRRVFETYWGDLADISQDDVLRPLVEELGLDPAAFFEAIAEPAVKERLRANTDELIARGGFGSPTMFIDG